MPYEIKDAGTLYTVTKQLTCTLSTTELRDLVFKYSGAVTVYDHAIEYRKYVYSVHDFQPLISEAKAIVTHYLKEKQDNDQSPSVD